MNSLIQTVKLSSVIGSLSVIDKSHLLKNPAAENIRKYLLKLSVIMIDKESMTMEIWDLYDEQGQKTGETWERSRAREIPQGRYHKEIRFWGRMKNTAR